MDLLGADAEEFIGEVGRDITVRSGKVKEYGVRKYVSVGNGGYIIVGLEQKR